VNNAVKVMIIIMACKSSTFSMISLNNTRLTCVKNRRHAKFACKYDKVNKYHYVEDLNKTFKHRC
jgi:hypothetical protein